jgi:hypothetical protein
MGNFAPISAIQEGALNTAPASCPTGAAPSINGSGSGVLIARWGERETCTPRRSYRCHGGADDAASCRRMVDHAAGRSPSGGGSQHWPDGHARPPRKLSHFPRRLAAASSVRQDSAHTSNKRVTTRPTTDLGEEGEDHTGV